eukprot:TRINITY_DN839_c0_g2_i4.p1 TRINITY_DN839_c0_g2~~TRINITY_DN839_c0_g2_i4.p1  ORF type:complete len:233 (+),score=37.76 TRINITY_DN839_c0_g2_i4:100-798(+)
MSRNDQFGDQHARIEGMFDQLNQDLNERRRLLRGGANTTKINMELRKKQSTLGTEISALEEQLSKDDRSGKITRKEATRRADMIRALHNKKHKLDDVVSNSSDQSSRDGLFKKHGGANQRKQYDEEDETDSTRGLDNQQLVQMQRDTMDNQDKDLESLSAAIARQKHLGVSDYEKISMDGFFFFFFFDIFFSCFVFRFSFSFVLSMPSVMSWICNRGCWKMWMRRWGMQRHD